jgi:hypothetical protein
MKMSYIEKLIFSSLSVVSGIINVFLSLINSNPTCDLEGNYWKSKMEHLYRGRVTKTAEGRTDAEEEYRERVRQITTR